MEYNALIEQLLSSYKQIFAQQVELGSLSSWAQHKKSDSNELVRPSIPFVGKNYALQKTKILLYASAENLSNYTEEKGGWLDDDAKAINRHRLYFDKNKETEFFPNVHIAPISDGSLLIVLRYICEKLAIDLPNNPKDFLDCIAFANFGKFSIEVKDGVNKDYANDKTLLDNSMEYVKMDISLLQPDIIVMFKSIYSTEKCEIDAIKGGGRVICTYQINARTVNLVIHKKYQPKDVKELSGTLQDWFDIKHFNKNKFTNKTHANFLSVFTYLDQVIEAHLNQQ